MNTNYYLIKIAIPLGLALTAGIIFYNINPAIYVSVASLTLATSKIIVDIIYDKNAEIRIKKAKIIIYLKYARNCTAALNNMPNNSTEGIFYYANSLSDTLSNIVSCCNGKTKFRVNEDRDSLRILLFAIKAKINNPTAIIDYSSLYKIIDKISHNLTQIENE